MTSSYHYVQIVADEDWGLVGIVPHGGTPLSPLPTNSASVRTVPSQTDLKGEKHKDNLPVPIKQERPEAIVINKRRPVKQIMTRCEDRSLATPSEPSTEEVNADQPRGIVDESVPSFKFREVPNTSRRRTHDNLLLGFAH